MVLMKIVTENVSFKVLNQMISNQNKYLSNVIQMCLAKRPNRRPTAAQSLPPRSHRASRASQAGCAHVWASVAAGYQAARSSVLS